MLSESVELLAAVAEIDENAPVWVVLDGGAVV